MIEEWRCGWEDLVIEEERRIGQGEWKIAWIIEEEWVWGMDD